jgi:riboflavin kinase/FMN adenylyltransferase
VALTFNPHPAKVLAPRSAPQLIHTTEQKKSALNELGLDHVVVQRFDSNFAQISAEDFFHKILQQHFQPKLLWLGHDFTFGYRREGTLSHLSVWCQSAGVDLQIVPAFLFENTLVSSSLIRKHILQGEVALAGRLLGRLYGIEGSVVQGQNRGTALGIHTANLNPVNELIPQDGVYATWVWVDGKRFPGATNIGYNPTFANHERSIETHIFDFDQNLYHKSLRLEFVDYVRAEIRFVSPQALVQQIQKDITHIRGLLNA